MQEIHTLILPCPQPFSSAMYGVAAFSDMDSALHKKPAAHRRDNSDELDVFEAASYYSGVADASFPSGIQNPYGTKKEERRALGGGGGVRRSIDVPTRAPLPSQYSHKGEKPTKEKKTKQPISPGGRLASFLNSFFHQGSSKKKSKSAATMSTAHSCKDDDSGSPSGRRKRRSSVSHSRSARTSDSSSFAYSSSSRFRTPSLVYPQVKVKVEDARTFPRSQCNGQATPAGSCPPTEAFHEGRSSYGDRPWEKSRRASTNAIFDKVGCSYYGRGTALLERDAAYRGGFAERKWVLNKDSKGMACRDLLRADDVREQERNLWRREEEEEDGGESDSSSDLFELPNCDLLQHHLASGLPVYETTSMESIKRGSMASVTV